MFAHLTPLVYVCANGVPKLFFFWSFLPFFYFLLSIKTHTKRTQKKYIKNTVLKHIYYSSCYLIYSPEEIKEASVVLLMWWWWWKKESQKNPHNFFYTKFNNGNKLLTTFSVGSASVTELDTRCWSSVYNDCPVKLENRKNVQLLARSQQQWNMSVSSHATSKPSLWPKLWHGKISNIHSCGTRMCRGR